MTPADKIIIDLAKIVKSVKGIGVIEKIFIREDVTPQTRRNLKSKYEKLKDKL